VSDLHLAFVALLLDLCPAGAASARTLGHLNLTHTPINLWVVLTKPGVSQCHVLVAKTGYCKLSAWSRYRRTTSTTSQMDPASLAVPSTLYTGMGHVRARVVSWFFRT
jgi:hypothetical protein